MSGSSVVGEMVRLMKEWKVRQQGTNSGITRQEGAKTGFSRLLALKSSFTSGRCRKRPESLAFLASSSACERACHMKTPPQCGLARYNLWSTVIACMFHWKIPSIKTQI